MLGSGAAVTRLALHLQAPREILAGLPHTRLQSQQLCAGVLQEVGDVGLDEAKALWERLGAGRGRSLSCHTSVATNLAPKPAEDTEPVPGSQRLQGSPVVRGESPLVTAFFTY